MTLGTDLVAYLGTLVLAGGDHDGEAFRVLGWERRFLLGAFRVPGDSALSVGRGNGKSALVAGLATAVIDPGGPLHGVRREVICCAKSFEQARPVFDDCRRFLETKYDLTDRTVWRVQDSSNRMWLEHRSSGARMRCIGSDAKAAHGLRPLLVLADEPSQWEPASRDRMLAALRTGLGKVPGSRLIALGTRPAADGHFFARMLNGECAYSQTHAAGLNDPPFRVATWRKANPSLDHLPSLLAKLREEAVLARQDPAHRAAFDALRLNLGTEDVEAQVLLEASLWEELVRLGPSESAEPGQGGCWGVDLGGSAASSAVACFEPATGVLRSLAAFPEVPPLPERGLRDGVGRLYVDCHKRGELLTVGEHAVSYVALLAESLARFGRPSVIAADRWKAADLLDAMSKAGLRGVPVDFRGQGFRDGGEDVRHFRRACLERRVRPEPNLFLASAVAEARTTTDASANSKLAKGSEGGRRLRARDDCAAASILAVSLAERHPRRESSAAYLGLVG